MVLGILKHFDGERYDALAFVIMDDHVHLLIYPYTGFSLEGLCSSWKSFSAYQLQRQFGRQGAIWQKESYDRIVRNEQELQEKANYILNNAFKRWPEVVEYKWIYPQREG